MGIKRMNISGRFFVAASSTRRTLKAAKPPVRYCNISSAMQPNVKPRQNM